MVDIGWLGLLLVGCAGTGGPRPGGPGGEEDVPTGVDDTGTPEEEEPEVVVTACGDGSADYRTVQEAVDAAPEGAVVALCGTAFTETVLVDGRTLTLRGETGATIDGGGTTRALEVRATTTPTTVTVEGVTLTGGMADIGGAVWCEGATLTLTDSTISASTAHNGGGIATLDCDVTLLRTEVVTNRADADGGGAYLQGGTATVTDSHVASNAGADGGGLYVTAGATGVTSGTIFEDNTGHVGGGAWFEADYAFTHNVVRRNHALFTGGGFAGDLATGEISYNEVYENDSGTDGGGGFTRYGTGHVYRNSFHDNVGGDDAGGLRMIYGGALIEQNTFVSNTSSGDGGALKVSHNHSDVRNNVFEDNSTGGRGGALEIDDDVTFSTGNTFRRNHAGGSGGAVHMNMPFYDLQLTDSVFEDNSSDECGGGIGFDGKGFRLETTRLSMTGNTAARGGGICAHDGTLVLENGIFAENTASSAGGGMFFEQLALSLANVVLYGNDAPEGAAMTLRSMGTVLVSDSILANNQGDAVAANASSAPTWRYSAVWANTGTDFVGMRDPTGADGNFAGNPAFVDAAAGDFHLAPTSPAIDAGDPTRTDVDGSRGDLGAFGGPGGAAW
jgi:nitrous oxidase accessory protein NosD